MLRMKAGLFVGATLYLMAGVAGAVPVEVKVAEVASNAIEAKAKAIASAEQQAFESYVLQNAPTEAAKILEVYGKEQISQFVTGYEVVEEKITDRSYRATLKVDVNEQVVNALFDTAKTAHSSAPLSAAEREDGAILVLPVTKDASGILLWEAENNWREAFNAAALQRGFGKLVMPYGDPTDRLMIDAGNVTTAGFTMLSGLARRYGASDILIAVMQPSLDNPAQALQVDLRFLSAGQSKRQIVNVKGEEDRDYAALLSKAATKVVDGLAKQLQMKQLAASGDAPLPRTTLNAVLPLSDVRDWAELQERLGDIQVIESVDVLEADWQQVTMALTFRGTPETLGQQLGQANIHVKQGQDTLMLALR